MSIVWRPQARSALVASLEYVSGHDDGAGVRLNSVVELAVRRLELRPTIARPAGYPGCRVWSLTKWSKLIVFRETMDGIEIVAFLDTRQTPPERV